MNNIQYKAVAAPYTDRQLFNAKFSRDGRLLIAGSYQGDLRRFDLTEDEPTELTPFGNHHGWVQAFALHPTENLLISGDSWGKLQARTITGKPFAPVVS